MMPTLSRKLPHRIGLAVFLLLASIFLYVGFETTAPDQGAWADNFWHLFYGIWMISLWIVAVYWAVLAKIMDRAFSWFFVFNIFQAIIIYFIFINVIIFGIVAVICTLGAAYDAIFGD